ncbi:hypothetical protein OAO55_01140 [Bacteroidales bacterium]|nr:hypothetical protein [Bacteroidales bacterium]
MNIKFLTYFRISFFLSICSLSIKAETIHTFDTTTFTNKKFIQEGYQLSKHDQEKAKQYFKQGAAYHKAKNDTISYLNSKIALSLLEKHIGNYNQSFEILWDVLPIAETMENKEPLVKIHRHLGTIYGIYGKDSLALHHLGLALAVSKHHLNKNQHTSTYLEISNQYFIMNDYNRALTYLDSCYIKQNTNKRLHYIDARYGYIYLKKKDFRKASIYLNDLIPYFKKNTKAFLAQVYYFQGLLKSGINQPDSAIYYYQKSLESIENMHVHIEFKPLILEQLAHEYFKANNKTLAFEYMQEAKAMSDSLFHTQSKHNKVLFEIKTQYKEDLTKKEAQLLAQQKLLELKDKARLRLMLLIGILIIVAIISIITIRLRTKMKRVMYEQSVNKEKNEAIITVKNKELTANALQIIEKENAVNELLETIQAKLPEQYSTMRHKFKKSNKKIWDDFQLRFTQTNNKFYEQLLELHPRLTQTDLKHCALIKLNFDSKEMSQILGISVHSVHISRSRIRKKMGLEREDSLGDYVAGIN